MYEMLYSKRNAKMNCSFIMNVLAHIVTQEQLLKKIEHLQHTSNPCTLFMNRMSKVHGIYIMNHIHTKILSQERKSNRENNTVVVSLTRSLHTTFGCLLFTSRLVHIPIYSSS